MGEDVAEISLPIRHRSEQATEGTSTNNHGTAPRTHRAVQESSFSEGRQPEPRRNCSYPPILRAP
jgi:hypothetical protein